MFSILNLPIIHIIINNLFNGMQQITSILNFYYNRWNELYLPHLGANRNLPKVSMQQFSDHQSVTLHKADLENYQKLVADLHFLVGQPWLFKICLLLTLTLPPDKSGGTNPLHKRYLNILRRRLEWIHQGHRESNTTTVKALSPELEFTKIIAGIRMLNRVSEIAMKIMSFDS
jgi:hypothetical protein